MKTVDIPQTFVQINVQRLGKKYKIHAITAGHRIQCNEDVGYDTSLNAVLNASPLTKEEALSLTDLELDAIYNEVIKLSYPGIAEKIEEGEVKPLSKEDEKSLKKK